MFFKVLIFVVQLSLINRVNSVDIAEGSEISDNILDDSQKYTQYLIKDGHPEGYICPLGECLRKCCPIGKGIVENECVEIKSEQNDTFFGLIETRYNSTEVYVIEEKIVCNGSIEYVQLPNFNDTNSSSLVYCVDYFPDIHSLGSLMCDESPLEKSILNTGMIISMPFLIATFLVYALLPDKNLPAKSLMCYVLSLLFAYIMLVTIQLNSNLEHGACVTIAYLCYFFFMVSFFWMNSSCIDIWLTFSGIKGITGQRTQERKRFIYYCLYSWGLPLIMTSIVVVMTMEHLKDSIFFTAIGDGQCWFKNGLSTGIYFYFPIAILLITNIVLFAITALKIRNVQRDTKVLNAKDSSKHEKDKQRIDEYNSEPCYLIEPVKNRGMQVYDFLDVDNSCLGFNLYIKLLFAMGVNWSMEVISWLVQWQSNNVPTYIWYITDFCNAMYGVLIFFIFVFKKNIWIMLKKRYLQIMGRSTRAHSMGTSTHRTTLFTAISLQSIPGAGLLTKMHSTPNDNRNELRPPKIH
ncbi:G-protein coupled receptor Mth2-like isoform X15 [Onthophagus taurus]|uniref:G-protein coupled receptor Mth2-like isoform X15 n=1 Tax=Onthophagus taurus TaxID=166361 RepID=UPI0039BDD9FB